MTDRHQRILDLLSQQGEVRVAELSRMFEVSEVSIRGDLSELESRGLLTRVRGGAICTYEPYYNMSLAQRSATNREEKEAIAAEIATLIHDHQAVMMNAGTTCLAVMRHLIGKRDITIITNSIVLALEGAKHRAFKIVLLGGEVDPEYQYVYGTLPLSQLERYRADTFIISADGLSAEGGLTTYYDQEADLCRKMMGHARTTIAALDHTKLGRVALSRIAEATEVDILVTNPLIPAHIYTALTGCGIQIKLAKEIIES